VRVRGAEGRAPHGRRGAKIAKELRDWVGKEIGRSPKPKDIRFGDNLPKTRSGKIMRRLLRSIAKGRAITQDVSTLENPADPRAAEADTSEGAQPVRLRSGARTHVTLQCALSVTLEATEPPTTRTHLPGAGRRRARYGRRRLRRREGSEQGVGGVGRFDHMSDTRRAGSPQRPRSIDAAS
jgi:hypothetical protein